MALNNTTADALAVAICAALGIVDAASIQKMKDQWRVIYSGLKTDIQITIQMNAIATSGSAAAQQGPPNPVNISPN